MFGSVSYKSDLLSNPSILHTYHHKRRIYEMIMDECHISVPIIHKFCASALLTYLSL